VINNIYVNHKLVGSLYIQRSSFIYKEHAKSRGIQSISGEGNTPNKKRNPVDRLTITASSTQ
jgi:hypothetical protein